MQPPLGLLLSLGAALVTFLSGGFCGSPSHSLCYFYLQLSEASQHLPQLFIRSYLDEQPIACFDSLTRKMEPLVPWMEEAEKGMFLNPEWVFRIDLRKLSQRDYHAGVLHTWQVTWGCKLGEGGSKGGFFHYGYNGMDFISFDKETLRWVTAQPQAQKVKQKWEHDPELSKNIKISLEKTCIEWLQTYLLYKKKVLEMIEPPVGKVAHKVIDDSLEVLICQAFGFYPKEIQVTWRRDGEPCKYDILTRNVAPNSDGTYYAWLSIQIDPKERDHFQCYLEHEGLKVPLVLAFKEKPVQRIPVGTMISLTLGFGGLLLFYCWWRSAENSSQKGATFPEQDSPGMVYCSPINGTEDEIQSQELCYVKESQMVPKVNASTSPSPRRMHQKVKGQLEVPNQALAEAEVTNSKEKKVE